MPSIKQSTGIFQLPAKTIVLDNDETQSSSKYTTYMGYPSNRPFVNNSPIEDASPNLAFPENINEGIMKAICKLHNKMILLQSETPGVKPSNGTNKFYPEDEVEHQKLGDFTYSLIDQSDIVRAPNLDITEDLDITFGATEVHKRLQSAEEQAFHLEKALSGMRTMLNERNEHKFATSSSAGNPAPGSTRYSRALSGPRRSTEPAGTTFVTPSPRSTRRTDIEKIKKSDIPSARMKAQLDKISQLEIAQLRLASTQTLSENKITELEEKLKQEKFHRKLMQEKAAKLQKTADNNQQILDEVKRNSPPFGQKKSNRLRKSSSTSSVASVKPRRQSKTPPPPTAAVTKSPCRRRHHYSPPTTAPTTAMTRPQSTRSPSSHRSPQKPIPFVTGSTAPSHSVHSNLQEVWSLLNTHNAKRSSARITKNTKRQSTKKLSSLPLRIPDLVNNLAQTSPPGTKGSPRRRSPRTAVVRTPVTYTRDENEADYLMGLLKQLEAEFSILNDKHEVYCSRLDNAAHSPDSGRTLLSYEHKVATLVAEMQDKAVQINNLRSYFLKVVSPAKSAVATTGGSTIAIPLAGNQIQVTTTIKTKPTTLLQNNDLASSNQRLLNNLRDIKYKLKKQDLSWSD